MVGRYLIIGLCAALACSTASTTRDMAGPSIAIGADEWGFGTIERGETAAGRVSIGNTGSDTLNVSLYSTCDCLSAKPEQAAIPPGGKLALELTYTGDEIKHPVTKTVFIDSNDPQSPRITFKVTGTVTPGSRPHLVAVPNPLALDPAAPLYPQAELTIKNRGEETLEILDVTCFGCTNTWGQRVLAGGEEAYLEIMPLPDWDDRRWLEIESNDPVEPLKKITIVELD